MMSKEDFKLSLDGGRSVRVPGHLVIVASRGSLSSLRNSLGSDVTDGLTMYELELSEKVPNSVIDKAKVVVVEVEPGRPESMARLTQISERRPDLPQVVALTDANISTVRLLLRRGVADVVSIPFQIEEILEAAANAAENSAKTEDIDVELAPLMAIVRSKGGEGATTITTHLASHLVKHAPTERGVCIMDLDVQYGTIAPALGLTPRRSLEDLLEAGDRIDSSVLRSVVVERGDGIHLISAPFDIRPLEEIDTSQLLRVIDLARREYDYVLLDLPANWTNWNLSTLLEATEILMVVELDITSLRQAKRWLQLFQSVGVKSGKVSIVVNRVEKRLFGSISLTDVKEALNLDVLVGLPNERGKLSTAQDQGLLLSEIEGKNKFDAEMAKLADLLHDRFSREQE